MNYPRNRHHHKPGDLILHDSDAKEPYMLMRFLKYGSDGRGQTEYLDDDLCRKWGSGEKSKLWNRNSVLHRASRFNVETPNPEAPCPQTPRS